LLGETCVDGTVSYAKVTRDVCKSVGYDDAEKGLDYGAMEVSVHVEPQSPAIGNAVWREGDQGELGAGDQGMMYGYATNEWDDESLHPFSHFKANQICEELAKARHSGEISWLRPDCKSQVCVKYARMGTKIKPISIDTVLVSTQHDEGIT